MYFPHNGNIVPLNQITSDNQPPNSNLLQNTPWYVPSVQADLAQPHVNYVELYSQCSIPFEKDPLNYYFSSWDFIAAVDRVISPMGA